jgi:sugar phosphate permease
MGVLVGGVLSDRWFRINSKGRIYTGAIGLALTIPALLLMGYGYTVVHVVGAAFLFGFGFGLFDTNNMPILCQFVGPNQRATAYGFLNTAGIFAGAVITDYLGKSTDAGNLGADFAMLSVVVAAVIIVQLIFLNPVKRSTENL